MPRDPSFETAEKLVGYIEQLLEHFEYSEMFLFHLDDLDDIGTLRMVFAGTRKSMASGAQNDESVGMTMRELFPSIIGTPISETYARVLRTQKPEVLPPIRYGDERIKEQVYQITCYPLSRRMLGLWVRNITEIEQLEREKLVAIEQLKLQTRALERTNEELENFAYVASHDLKAPLRDIANLASWITEDAMEHLPSGSAQHLERLCDRVTRMQNLLNDLLAYSRAGRVARSGESIDMAQLLDNIRILAAPPDDIEVVLPDDIAAMPTLHTPRAPLEQILRNLVSNAVKHRDEHSQRVAIDWRDAGDFVKIMVSDDGPGIAAKFHERIFRLFTTLRPRDQLEGSGMGLAIVKKLVEAHGGAITVDSQGRGATFCFTWPKEWNRTPRSELEV